MKMEIRQSTFPRLPERLNGLCDIANNLWWSWNPAARMLYKKLERSVWKESGHNPVKMLNELPSEILQSAAKDPDYLRHYDVVFAQFQKYMNRSRFSLEEPAADSDAVTIAYFSAEYGLHHSIPFYAGGLGFLAGDHIKECSDLEVPLAAVGFMYPRGYVRQRIREDGWQDSLDEVLDRDATSISRAVDEKGEQLLVKVPLIDPPVHVAVWQVFVGRVSLYLMDTDIEINDPAYRRMSAHLYVGDREQRLRQEIVLGIGGALVLNTLGIEHAIIHLNEGHAAFALLDRIRERVQRGMTYRDAVDQVKETSVFTTHTPVAAGHDVFPFDLMDKYFHSYWPVLGLDRDGFMQLGVHPTEPGAGFNMTALALKMSRFRNGVSRRHGEVARRMWQSMWPDRSVESVPIDYVTNGVHLPTWIEPKFELLFNKYLGRNWQADHDDPQIWELIEDIPDKELWETHYWLKMKLINSIRERARQSWVNDHTSPLNVVTGGTLLDPSVLTLGFARRFAEYKRADLIFHDLERLKKMLCDRWKPVQIIFAGKAHPADDVGKRIIQRICNIARIPDLAGRVAFIEDYGEQLAQYLVHGVDVWLNNPLPPMEASGTSGMKAAINGVPHLSIMDGWWGEGYNGENGWSFGGDDGGGDRDSKDAGEIYRIMEKELIPLYYTVDEGGIPRGWVKVMKESIKRTAARFSSRRMVKEYVKKFYSGALKKAR